MEEKRSLWLVTNRMSGSNDERTLAAIRECCASSGMDIVRHTLFPQDDTPSPSALDGAGAEVLAIFAGDGTLNAVLDKAAGWGGEVLVLPGGTMNLLYRRLFGEMALEEAVQAVCGGRAHRIRPTIIRCAAGTAYAGLLAGPGTAWNRVRESMRENALLEMAAGTAAAIDETLNGSFVACTDPPLGRREGYPLLLLSPRGSGIDCEAYHAENAGEYLEQSWALLRRDFRAGPHDLLGCEQRLALASTDSAPFGLLLDGEPAETDGTMEFVLARPEVDLLATRDDG